MQKFLSFRFQWFVIAATSFASYAVQDAVRGASQGTQIVKFNKNKTEDSAPALSAEEYIKYAKNRSDSDFNAYLQNISNETAKNIIDSCEHAPAKGLFRTWVGLSKYPGGGYFTYTRTYVKSLNPQLAMALSVTGQSGIKKRQDELFEDADRAFVRGEVGAHIKYSDPKITILGKTPSFYSGLTGNLLQVNPGSKRSACPAAALYARALCGSFDLSGWGGIDDKGRLNGAIGTKYSLGKGISVGGQYNTPGAVQFSLTTKSGPMAFTIGFTHCFKQGSNSSDRIRCGFFIHCESDQQAMNERAEQTMNEYRRQRSLK